MATLKETILKIQPLDKDLIKKAQDRLDNLTKPIGSLGRLEELARQIAAISGKTTPGIKNKVIFTLAADHGVTEENVSAFPKEVTAQMVYNFLSGGAGINVLARQIGARVVIADIGVASELKQSPQLIVKKVNLGTKNMVKGPAMSKEEAVKCVEYGIELFEQEFTKGIDIAGTGEMGIGNTTAASAITAVITGKPVVEVTGKGTGLDEQGLKRKIEVIKKAIKTNKPDRFDALDVLSKVGGFEIGGLAGIILAAAANRVPVVIDGFISGAAGLIAFGIEPKVKDFIIAAHRSVEIGHNAIYEYLGLRPLLNLDMRLGEGTGACLAIYIAEAGVRILTEMATFQSASVSQEKK